MAPDLNSVPPSPRVPSGGTGPTSAPAPTQSTPASRRASQIFPMSPPPLPLASPGGTIPASVQNTYHHGAPPLSPSFTGSSMGSVDSMVPMRHPRPMTAAELHLELEKEQEAVVNRLTRELSALRAHTASVASTASSASAAAGLLDVTDPSLIGPTHPTASRRHRSSSSVSRTSHTGPSTYATGIPHSAATVGIPHSHRYSISSQSGAPAEGQYVTASSRTPSMGLSTPRYEEVAHYRQELEEAKKENELLRRRIRDLERELRGRRSGSTDSSHRGRSGRTEDTPAAPAAAAAVAPRLANGTVEQ